MAVAKVLNTTELLESILVNLSMKEIFHVKAVTRSWKHTIEDSNQIKRALFLAPDGDPIRPSVISEDTVKTFRSPLVANTPIQILPLFYMIDAPEYTDDSARPCPPGLRRRPWQHTVREATSNYMEHSFWWYEEHCTLKHGIHIPSACRSMYLTQPPITACKFNLTAFITPESPFGDGEIVVYDKDGVTLGQVADIAARVFQQYEKMEEDGETAPCDRWRYSLSYAPVHARFRMLP